MIADSVVIWRTTGHSVSLTGWGLVTLWGIVYVLAAAIGRRR